MPACLPHHPSPARRSARLVHGPCCASPGVICRSGAPVPDMPHLHGQSTCETSGGAPHGARPLVCVIARVHARWPAASTRPAVAKGCRQCAAQPRYWGGRSELGSSPCWRRSCRSAVATYAEKAHSSPGPDWEAVLLGVGVRRNRRRRQGGTGSKCRPFALSGGRPCLMFRTRCVS